MDGAHGSELAWSRHAEQRATLGTWEPGVIVVSVSPFCAEQKRQASRTLFFFLPRAL